MAREQIKVPFGYTPTEAKRKGSLFVFETFEDWTEEDVGQLAQWADERTFARCILYPQHEETLKRMGISCELPYYQRVKLLQQAAESSQAGVRLEVDAWEGKRKKYTPLDTSLRFLTDKHPGPYFIAMSDRYANLFVTYPSFQEWIKKARLIILARYGVPLLEKLHGYAERWEALALPDDAEARED